MKSIKQKLGNINFNSISNNNKKPNFLVIGVQKAGTTSLHAYLKKHPQIEMSIKKETRFFSKDEIYQKGPEYYFSLFNYRNSIAIGEVCPEYLIRSRVSARRIKEILGEPKFIIILRNPIERAYSHYWMQRNKGLEKRSFKKAVHEELKELGKINCDDWFDDWEFKYISCGLYYRQIKAFLDIFEKKDFLLINYSNYRQNCKMVLETIFNFIGVKSYNINLTIYENAGYRQRSELLGKIIRSQNKMKKNILYLLPKSFKNKLKQVIINKNKIKIDYNKIDIGLKKEMESIYKVENIKLEKLMGFKFDI